MKNISFLVVAVCVLLISCHNEEVIQTEASNNLSSELKMVNIATNQEYIKLTSLEKNIVDMINSSLNGLKGLSLNDSKNLNSYFATINISSDVDNNYQNYILFSKDSKENSSTKLFNGCRVCGISSGIRCARAIVRYIKDNGLKDLDVHITVDGDCYDVKY